MPVYQKLPHLSTDMGVSAAKRILTLSTSLLLVSMAGLQAAEPVIPNPGHARVGYGKDPAQFCDVHFVMSANPTLVGVLNAQSGFAPRQPTE